MDRSTTRAAAVFCGSRIDAVFSALLAPVATGQIAGAFCLLGAALDAGAVTLALQGEV
jgi:hypothetical protein